MTPTVTGLALIERAIAEKYNETFPYVYRWDRCERKGQRCKVTARGKMNSCCVEFDDGFRMVTSRNAIRKAKP